MNHDTLSAREPRCAHGRPSSLSGWVATLMATLIVAALLVGAIALIGGDPVSTFFSNFSSEAPH